MASILAYTSPRSVTCRQSARFSRNCHAGATIHLRTFSVGVEIWQRLGFTTDAIDSRIEAIEHDDWKATNPRAALNRAVAVVGGRATHEVADLADAVGRVHPDALLVDVNSWGALSGAESGGIA